jgi:hypothetical protein
MFAVLLSTLEIYRKEFLIVGVLLGSKVKKREDPGGSNVGDGQARLG